MQLVMAVKSPHVDGSLAPASPELPALALGFELPQLC